MNNFRFTLLVIVGLVVSALGLILAFHILLYVPLWLGELTCWIGDCPR
jgi:hypothetical protein